MDCKKLILLILVVVVSICCINKLNDLSAMQSSPVDVSEDTSSTTDRERMVENSVLIVRDLSGEIGRLNELRDFFLANELLQAKKEGGYIVHLKLLKTKLMDGTIDLDVLRGMLSRAYFALELEKPLDQVYVEGLRSASKPSETRQGLSSGESAVTPSELSVDKAMYKAFKSKRRVSFNIDWFVRHVLFKNERVVLCDAYYRSGIFIDNKLLFHRKIYHYLVNGKRFFCCALDAIRTHEKCERLLVLNFCESNVVKHFEVCEMYTISKNRCAKLSRQDLSYDMVLELLRPSHGESDKQDSPKISSTDRQRFVLPSLSELANQKYACKFKQVKSTLPTDTYPLAFQLEDRNARSTFKVEYQPTQSLVRYPSLSFRLPSLRLVGQSYVAPPSSMYQGGVTFPSMDTIPTEGVPFSQKKSSLPVFEIPSILH